MNVLHLSFSLSWRGGENQLLSLALGLTERGINNYFSIPLKSALATKVLPEDCCFLISPYFFDPRNIKNLISYIKTNKIQILHAHCSKSHTLGIILKKKYPELKLVIHRRVAFNKKKPWFNGKYLFSGIDAYIAISNTVKEELIVRGVNPKNIYVIPSSIDIKKYSGDKKLKREILFNYFKTNQLDLPNSTLFIGTASAFSKEKGLVDLIEALSLIEISQPEIKNIALIMAGDGKEKNNIIKCIKKHNLLTPIVLIGHIKNIPEFLLGLDIFVMPSHFEGLGSVVLEALASRCGVISSDAGGLREIVQNEFNGLIYPSGNQKELAKKILYLINNIPLMEKLSQNGYHFVSENYNQQKMIESTLNLYKIIVKS
jgi:glycosyltransferase involved in cell wall biosynthesis